MFNINFHNHQTHIFKMNKKIVASGTRKFNVFNIFVCHDFWSILYVYMHNHITRDKDAIQPTKYIRFFSTNGPTDHAMEGRDILTIINPISSSVYMCYYWEILDDENSIILKMFSWKKRKTSRKRNYNNTYFHLDHAY